MSWIAVGVAGAGMTMSYLNNQEKKKNEKADMLANADAMRYSPWTKMNPTMQTHQAGSDMAAALGGGLQGAAFGSQFHKASPSSPSPAPDAVNAGTDNTLGSQDMSKQLGANVPAMQAQMAPMSAPPPAPNPQLAAANSPAFQMDMNNGANPGSPWGVMGRKKQTLYGSY